MNCINSNGPSFGEFNKNRTKPISDKPELLGKLSKAQNQKASGDKGKTLKDVMQNIRQVIDANR